MLVAINLSAEHRVLDLSGAGEGGEALCSTYLDTAGRIDLAKLTLRPEEGILVSLAS